MCPNCNKLAVLIEIKETEAQTTSLKWDYDKKKYKESGFSKEKNVETWVYCKKCHSKTRV